MFVCESLEDILKPKSEKEIEAEISKFTPEELYDLWEETGTSEYLKRSLQKGKELEYSEIEEIFRFSLINDKEIEKLLLPKILSKFNDYNDLQIEKIGNKYILKFDGWESFLDILDSDISEENLDKILSGNARDVFEYYGFIEDLSNYNYEISKMNINENYLKKFIFQELKNKRLIDKIEELQNIYGFSNVFNFILKNEDNLPETVQSIKNAIEDIQMIADEKEAFKDITDTIKINLDFNKIIPDNTYLKTEISEETFLRIFKILSNAQDKIIYRSSNYNGSISEYESEFEDNLNRELDDRKIDDLQLSLDLKESLNKILKPKSKKQLIKDFKKLSIYEQAKILENPKYEKKIPEKDWPLIKRIKNYIEKSTDFYSKGVLERLNDPYGNVIGVKFVFYEKNIKISVFHYNNSPNRVQIFNKRWGLNEHINNYKEFLQFIKNEMKAKFIYEVLKGGKGDNLSPNDVDSKQLSIGLKVEREHTNDTEKIEEIALDHLAENKKYYSELVEKGLVDEKDAIKEYIKHFGISKLPEKYKKYS